MDEFKGVADVERIIGDAQTGAVTLDDRAAFGFALDADDVEVGPQSGGFEPHGTASGPDVPQRAGPPRVSIGAGMLWDMGEPS